MKTHFLPLLFLGCWHHCVKGQIIGQTFGAECLSLAKIGTLSPSGFEVFNNPALIAKNTHTSLNLFHTTPYFQKNLAQAGICFQNPGYKLPFGFGLIQQGNSYFNQQLISTSIAKKLSKHLYLGAGFNYLITQQFQLPSRGNFIGTIGMFFQLNEKWNLSSHIINLNGASYALERTEIIPTIIQLGSSFQFNDQLVFYAEIEQALKQQSTSKLGLKYQLNNQFNLLFGYKNNPQQPSFGASYKSKKTKIILGTNHHRFLGFSSFVEFQFVIGQKK